MSILTRKFSQFVAENLNNTNQYVGLSGGVNAITPAVIVWTTATRPTTPTNGQQGFNTNLNDYEFWSALTTTWIPFGTGVGPGVTDVSTGTGLTGGPITSTGTISFAPITASSFWANASGVTAVPTVIPLNTFLFRANNLSDLTSASAARGNLGLVIGTNVEAWSALLDEIASGTWPGATSINTVGTITTGIWNGVPVTVPFGGTGDSTFTPYTLIAAGVTATSAFQNVVSVGTAGQVLTSNGAGTLPTFQNTGSGNVNPGLIDQVAYYAAAGSTISGLATANNGALITSNTGVPSISSTLPNAVQLNITSLGTVTTGVFQGTPVGMAFGGTNANLTATVNNLVYSTATQMALLPTGNNSVLVTSNTGVPSISSTLPALVQGNITAVGTIASGTWQGNTVTVPFGGSGNTTFTAFSILTAGTTATGAFQNVSGTGTIGQVLTSQGAGVLPQWSNTTGSGTVNSGGINDLAYYAAAGTVISGLATANNGTLITSGAGVPSISTTLPSAVQLNITSLGTVTTGLWNATPVTVPFGGTGNTTFTAFSVICAGTTATGVFQNVVGVGSSGQALTSNGAGALPTWQNVAGSGTVNTGVINDLAFYASSTNAVSPLSTANGGALVTSNTGVPSILAGTGVTGNILRTISGGTPAWSNAAYPSSTTANQILYSSSSNVVAGLATQASSVLVTDGSGVPSLSTTLPSGLTIPGYQTSLTLPLSLSNGGTGANLTASNGGIFYSTGTVGAILAGTATAQQLLLSGASTTPQWSTTTYPLTNAINTLLYASSANVMAALATANSSILVTSSGGVPSWSTTVPSFTTGTITFSPTTGGLVGTTTNDNTTAGNVGEYKSTIVLVGAPVNLSSSGTVNVCVLSLTAGDWDVWGELWTGGPTGTSISTLQGFITTSSTTQVTTPGDATSMNFASQTAPFVVGTNNIPVLPIAPCRITMAGTANVYLECFSIFTVHTATGWGKIAARRVR